MIRAGLVGGKLGHSYSPRIHELIWESLGLTGSYDLLECTEAEACATIQAARAHYLGLNVTVPHKVTALRTVTELSAAAAHIGAVNTLHFAKDQIKGYNTDYIGFRRSLRYYGINVKGRQVVVLGTGGAARSVLQALVDEGAHELMICSRSPQQAAALLGTYEGRAHYIDYALLTQSALGTILINTTPVGMHPQGNISPVTESVAKRFATVVDIIYNPRETLLLQWARQAGHKAYNGLFMLIAQAVAAEEIWLERTLPDALIISLQDKLLQEGL